MVSIASPLPSNSLVFYDIETSGLDPDFDQILQVAAIHTDKSLTVEPPTESFMVRARRDRCIVPSPGAMLTTRLTGAELENGSPLSEVMLAVYDRFRAWSPALFIGYNSGAFDERILHHNLFRCLLPPYLTQSGGSRRADLMTMLQAATILRPSAIKVPAGENGRPTFRLGQIARANGILFEEREAHDALADVRATVAVARILRECAPMEYEWALELADPQKVRLHLCGSNAVLWLRVIAGVPTVRPIIVVCGLAYDRNAFAVFDLGFDPDDYIGLDDSDVRCLIESNHSPIITLRLNAQPMLVPLDHDLPWVDHLLQLIADRKDSPEKLGASGKALSFDELNRRALRVIGAEKFAVRVKSAAEEARAARPPSPLIERQLYDGFASQTDFLVGEAMLRAPPRARPALIERILDPRLREHALRLVYAETPQAIDVGDRDRLDVWLRNRISGPEDAVWRTVAGARRELDQLRDSRPEDTSPLNEIETYLASIETSAPR